MSLTLKERLSDKAIALFAYTFPLSEMICYFKFSCIGLILPINHLVSGAFGQFVYVMTELGFFAVLLGYFLILKPNSRYEFRKFVRFNVAQAMLIHMLLGFICYIWQMLPAWICQSALGFVFQSTFYLVFVGTIIYCMQGVCAGYYTEIPIISEAAEIHTPRRQY
jgi:hypothetical protein